MPGKGAADGAARVDAPAVSVVLTAWNAESTIERAIRSILAESAVPLECIVVDDGSTDGTIGVVESIALADARLVVVRAPGNEGVSAARNRGLRAARGQWLAFVDADDRLRPGGLAALWHACHASDVCIVIGQRIWSNGVRTWVGKDYDNPDVRQPGRKSLVRNLGLVYYLSVTGKLFHRSCVSDLWFSGRDVADQPWTIRALLRAGDRVEVIDAVVYEYDRPAPGEVGSSVTTTTRSRADFSADGVRSSTSAVLAVDAAAAAIGDEDARRRLGVAYVERLLVCELSAYLDVALKRRDPGLYDLLDAIERFVRDAPPGLIAGSTALGRLVLAPPIERWSRLPGPARREYWRLLAAAQRADRRVISAVTRKSTRWTLRVATVLPSPLRPAAPHVLRLWLRTEAWIRSYRARPR